MDPREERRVIVGRVAGLHGVRGWVKVVSYTDPPVNLLGFARWQLREADGWRSCEVAESRSQGNGLLARLEGVTDRDQASALLGTDIAVARSELPPPAAGEYYWADLEGLLVSNLEGLQLGRVERLIATGANDVLVVRGERERLVPFVHGSVVRSVDLENGEIRVDWDADF
jgi:16S rRNA processing protein RimM